MLQCVATVVLSLLLAAQANGVAFRFTEEGRRRALAATGDENAAPFAVHDIAAFNATQVYVTTDPPDSREVAFAVTHSDAETIVAEHVESDRLVVLIADASGAVHAMVREPTRVTRVFPKGKHYIQTVQSTRALPDEMPPLVASAPARQLVRRTTCEHPVIRVGVLHTAAAALEVGSSAGVELDVRTAVIEANAAVLPSSGVSFRLELCTNTLLDGFEEATRPSATLGRFSRSQAVARIKAARGCSVMVLYSSMAGLGNSACGIGELPGSYAAVASTCFTNNFSFLHELGHCCGCCHGTPPGPDCSGGRNAYADTGAGFRTILAYRSTCRGCPRVGRFSNSDSAFSWRGTAIGNAGHDNAKALNENGPVLALGQCN